jgi:anti-anti-sigma factor
MGIQEWSENILLVDLPPEPEMGDELKCVADRVHDKGGHNVIIDFSSVDIITSTNIMRLIKLRKSLADQVCYLILCNVGSTVQAIFKVMGLDDIFKIFDDKLIAREFLE